MSRPLRLLRAMNSLALLGAAACLDPESPSASTGLPIPPVISGPRKIAVGENVTDTITGADSECRFTTENGGWGGLCHAFEIPVQTGGILETIVTSEGPLSVFVKTSEGGQIDMGCCSAAALRLAVPAEEGAHYRLEVAYVGRPPGYPNSVRVPYAMTTRLLAPDTVVSASLRAILYADATRTQRMATGRVEIMDGPFAGTAATFDTVAGTYDIRGVPRGYVQIRASADHFGPVTVRVPIGVSVAQSIVLTRLVPLADDSHSLSGMTWASPNSAYTGVKVEILDGPHAGVFTFSLDDWGMYDFRGLTPGRIRVRASKDGLKPQTLEVMVSGTTRLDFRW